MPRSSRSRLACFASFCASLCSTSAGSRAQTAATLSSPARMPCRTLLARGARSMLARVRHLALYALSVTLPCE
eukprot:scaffold103623_cov63-Phaeocystis_antarctica.AAC.2